LRNVRLTAVLGLEGVGAVTTERSNMIGQIEKLARALSDRDFAWVTLPETASTPHHL
jgi:hypothetical protein